MPHELIAAIAKGVPIPAAAAPSEKKQPKATVGTTNGASSPEKASPPEAAAQQATPPKTETGSSGGASVTYEDVKNAIVKLSGAKGRDAVVELLKKFDARRGPDLKPEQFEYFVAATKEALSTQEA